MPNYWTFIATGKKFDFENFSEDDIRLEDIIHHLSLICRWNGGISEFYSVLDHSLYCLELIKLDCDYNCCWLTRKEKNRIFLLALLHDAHEAYIGDVITPVKRYMGDKLQELQQRLDIAIHGSLGISLPTEEEQQMIKKIDELAMVGESRMFMSLNASRWFSKSSANGIPKIMPVTQSIEQSRRCYRKSVLYYLDKNDAT